MTRVGLIGPAEREEIARLAMRIEERGGEAIVLDSRPDPAIVLEPGGERACGQDLRGITGLYVADLGIRPPIKRREDGRVDLEATRLAGAASRRHFMAWNALLARVALRARVVNPPQTHDLHTLKPWEMTVYAREKIPAPWTMATSEAARLLEIPPDREDGWITKGMVGGYTYTESFDPPRTAQAAAAALGAGTRMVQERIQGDNVRAFVLGSRVIGAAAVVSREGDETDSRRGGARVRRVTLPDAVAAVAVRAVACWGMHFAAVDFMVETRSGRYLVLECNSAPFFVNFEAQSGCDISSRLAEYLLGR